VLNKAPIKPDLLVVKKNADIALSDEIGEIFRTHNIIEFKSPRDKLDIDTYYTSVACALLYKSMGEKVNQIPVSELSVTMMHCSYPRKMFEMLRDEGARITRRHPGIYDIAGRADIPVQMIVTQLLDSERYPQLKVLSTRVTRQDAHNFITMAAGLKEKGDRDDADAIMQLVLIKNLELFESLRGDPTMCEALMELMKDEIDDVIEEKTAEKVAMMARESERAVREANERNVINLAEAVKLLMGKLGINKSETMDAMKVPRECPGPAVSQPVGPRDQAWASP